MKKILFTVLIMLLLGDVAFPQDFDDKSKAINLDLGLGRSFGVGKSEIPPISASYDMGLKQIGPGILSVGGLMGIASSKESFSNLAFISSYSYSYTYFLIGARGIYHWFPIKVDKLDVYGGVLLGCKLVFSKYLSSQNGGIAPLADQKTGFLPGVFVGGRYFFNDHFGVNAELGYSIAYFNIGGTFKF